MTFEWLVARRYLRSPHRPAVLRLVTVISVVGVAAGVATLVVALAMDTGFGSTMQDRLVGVTAHINLSRPHAEGITNYEQLAQRLAQLPEVRSATPAIYQTVLLSAGPRAKGVELKGIIPELEEKSDEALHRLVSGKPDFAQDSDGIPGIVFGQMLGDDLNTRVGDYVVVASPQGKLTPYGMIPATKRFRVSGIFNSGFYDFDANWAFIEMSAAQSLAGVGDEASVIEFRIADVSRAAQVADAIEKAAGSGFQTETLMEQNRALFRALHMEKLVTAIFVGLITFVAGLNILVVLSMTVTDRARDIAVLMSMGARRAQLRKVFFLQGLAIGGVGTLVGLVLGYGIAWVAGTYKLIPLDPEVYSIPYVPFSPNFLDAVWIALAALLICSAATMVPARAASHISPVEILRYE